MFCKKPRPDKATDRRPSPPSPGAGCVQREIQLSVLIHFYILCPRGSDEVTKSSVRIQRYTFKLDRCAAKKMLFQSLTVLFLSKRAVRTQRGKTKRLPLSLQLLLYVDKNKLCEFFNALM